MWLSSPVLGLHSVGRLTYGRFCRVCLGTGDFLPPQGAIPPGFYPLRGGGYCLVPEAPQKGECRRGRRYFWPCGTRVGQRAHLKNGLVAYSCVDGTQRYITEVSLRPASLNNPSVPLYLLSRLLLLISFLASYFPLYKG